MKKTDYIGKYDYINYYTKQPSFWFYSMPEILASLSISELEDDNEDDNESDDEAVDALEYFKQQRDALIELNKNDPKIIEGNLLDKKSRQHIINLYPNYKIVDFEQNEYRRLKQEAVAKCTEEILLTNENVICFQPVFIYKNLITKPDAIVKEGIEIKLFETKSTTTAKLVHFLDIFFQSKVLSQLEYLSDYYFEYNLCLSAYCYANKYEVPFITTNCINLNKTINLSGKPFACKQAMKLGLGYVKNEEFIDAPINITALCDGDFSDLELYIESTNGTRKKSLEKKQELIIATYNEFDSVIEQLTNHLKKMRLDLLNENSVEYIVNIQPHENDKSDWKAPDVFNDLKPLYIKQGYDLFNYSGNIVDLSAETLKSIRLNKITNIPFKKEYELLFKSKHPPYIVNHIAFENAINRLKNKKVYFDFETISSPIRSIDHSLPYTQIITQCSIIKDHNDQTSYDQMKGDNILFDPKNITIQNFKDLVDALYEGEDYSYVVYNISFEKSRLKELIVYINDQDYTQKIECIIRNLYDLADFFNITKTVGTIIVIKELYGFYSIKKVLKYIETYYPEIFTITGCHDYKKLKISNGLICQTETIKRFHDCITQEEWIKLSDDLKTYCENDVRAMIAVELLARKLASL